MLIICLLLPLPLKGNEPKKPTSIEEILKDPLISKEEKKKAFFNMMLETKFEQILSLMAVTQSFERTNSEAKEASSMAAGNQVTSINDIIKPEDLARAKLQAEEGRVYLEKQVRNGKKSEEQKKRQRDYDAVNNLPTLNVKQEIKSKYNIKGISVGEELRVAATHLLDKGFNIKHNFPDSLQLTKVKGLEKISVTETITLRFSAQLPDIVREVRYSVSTKINGTNTHVETKSTSVNELKVKLINKFGPPVFYDLLMTPSILVEKARYQKMFAKIDSGAGSVEYKRQQREVTQSNLERTLANLKYKGCVDKDYEIKHFGGCFSEVTGRGASNVKKSNDGSVVFQDNCYAWVQHHESIFLCGLKRKDGASHLSLTSWKVNELIENKIKAISRADETHLEIDF
jgi:hypothetical protein